MHDDQASQIQQDILRKMAPAERLRLACEMSDLARDLCRARIRRDYPEWTEEQVVRELVRAAFSPQPSPW